MKQVETEVNDHCLERFNLNILSVEVTGGKYFFGSKVIMAKEDSDSTTVKMNTEKDKMQAILLLKNTDEKHYGELSKSLKG